MKSRHMQSRLVLLFTILAIVLAAFADMPISGGEQWLFTLNITAAAGETMDIEVLAPYWEELGIKVNIRPIDQNLLEKLRTESVQTYAEGGWDIIRDQESVITDPDRSLQYSSMNVMPKGMGNPGSFNNGWVDDLLKAAVSEPDTQKRAQLTNELQEILWDEVPDIIMYQIGRIELFNKIIPLENAMAYGSNTAIGMSNVAYQMARYIDPIPGKDSIRLGYARDRRGYLTIYGSGYYCKGHSANLVYCNAAGGVDPELAESWEITNQGTTFTFHLRNDAYWSDGVQFTSSDAKFTLDTIMNPDSLGYFSVDFNTWIESVEAPDPFTLVINAKAAYMPLLAKLGHKYGVQMLPWHVMKDVPVTEFPTSSYNLEPGALPTLGPWKPLEFVPGQYTSYEAYNGSVIWKILEKDPPFKYCYIETVPDAMTQLLALETGELDILHSAGPWTTMYSELQGNPNYYTNSFPYPSFSRLILNLNHPQLSNKYVRQALACATPSEKIIEVSQSGLGTSTSLMWPEAQLSTEYKDARPFDLEEAKELLALAGYVQQAAEDSEFPLLAIVTAISGIAIGAIITAVVMRRRKG